MADIYSWLDGLSEVKPKAEYGEMSPELKSAAANGGITGATLRSSNPLAFDDNTSYANWVKQPIGTPMGAATAEEILNGPVMGTFAGVNSATANLKALNTARRMEASGMSNENIRQATGWFTDKTGKWLYEIPDNAAVVNPNGFTATMNSADKGSVGRNIKNYISHPEMEKAYPDLFNNTNVYITELDKPSYRGVLYHTPEQKKMFGKNIPAKNDILISPRLLRDKEELRKTLLHEMQHGVQYGENYTFLGDATSRSGSDYSAYRNLPHEAMAFDQGYRSRMTPEQLQRVAPQIMK